MAQNSWVESYLDALLRYGLSQGSQRGRTAGTIGVPRRVTAGGGDGGMVEADPDQLVSTRYFVNQARARRRVWDTR